MPAVQRLASYRILLIALIALGFWARVAGLGRESLLLDEAFTRLDAQGKCVAWRTNRPDLDSIDLRAVYRAPAGGLEDVTRAVIAQDAHPPFYFWGEHFAMKALGTSEAALRLPSVIAGTAAIPLTASLGRASFGARAGLLGAALMAFLPYPVLHSRQARPYMMMVCFLLLALNAAVRIVQGQKRRGLWGWLFLGSALSSWTHYGSFLILIPLYLRLGLKVWPGKVKKWLILCGLAAAIAYLPWVPAFCRQREWLGDGTGWLTESMPLGTERIGAAVRGLALALYTLLLGEPTGPLWDASPGGLLRAGLYTGWLGLLRWGFDQARRSGDGGSLLTGTAPGAVLLSCLIFLGGGVNLLAARYLIGSLPGCLLMMACALSRQGGGRRILALCLIAAGAFQGLHALYGGERPGAEGWREAASFVAGGFSPSDLLVFNASGVRVAFDLYFPFPAHETGWGGKGGAPALARKLQEQTSRHRRVWAIFSHTGKKRGEELMGRWLDKRFRKLTERRFPGIRVCLYECFQDRKP